jgi:hypothetical protein
MDSNLDRRVELLREETNEVTEEMNDRTGQMTERR